MTGISEQACCACLNIQFKGIEHEDGLMSDSWECTACESKFVRLSAVEHQLKLHKEQLGIWKRKAGENQRVAGRYQLLFEKAMKAVNKIDDVFEYQYKGMNSDQLRKYVYTALSDFTKTARDIVRSPATHPDDR